VKVPLEFCDTTVQVPKGFDLNIVVFIVIYVSYERQGCARSYIPYFYPV
jgi:hypothetical protein